MKGVKRLLSAYHNNPKRFKEILETARCESSIERQELKQQLISPSTMNYDRQEFLKTSVNVGGAIAGSLAGLILACAVHLGHHTITEIAFYSVLPGTFLGGFLGDYLGNRAYSPLVNYAIAIVIFKFFELRKNKSIKIIQK